MTTPFSFRMAEVQFLRALAGYFGLPLILIVVFTLLLFWICRYFGNNALVQGPVHNAPNAMAPRNVNLRHVAVATTLLLLVPTWGLSPECDSATLRKRFKKLLDGIHACDESATHGLYELRRALCDPIFDNATTTTWLTNYGLHILMIVCCSVAVIVLCVLCYRKRQQSNRT